MANWDSYTSKSTPADNDTLMIKDTTGGSNKRTPFSGVWNWIVGKLTSAVVSQLETTNKSIVPAINELNSKTDTVFKTERIQYAEGITIPAHNATYINIQISPPEGYSFLTITQTETNGNVGYAYTLYHGITSSDFNATIWLGNDRDEPKTYQNGVSITVLYVKTDLV